MPAPIRVFVVLTFIVTALTSSRAMPSSPQSFTEDFTTTVYKDTVNTTADWDTTDAELRLPPFVPSLVGQYTPPGVALNVALAGDLAIVASNNEGLNLIDISDPTNPTLLANAPSAGLTYDVVIAGDLAFVANMQRGLVVVDISDPTTPTDIAELATSQPQCRAIDVAGDLALLASNLGGLYAIDISDPANPTLMDNSAITGMMDVAIAGKYAYVVTNSGDVRVFDISDPSNLSQVAFYNAPGNAYDVSVDGDQLFVANGSSGLLAFDISDPENPVLIGGYATSGYCNGVALAGDRAFITESGPPSKMRAVDISDPAAMTLVSSMDVPGVGYRLAVAGERAFVAAGSEGMVVVQIYDRITPTYMGQYYLPGSTNDLATSGNLGFLTNYSTFIVIDLSDPANATEISTLTIPGASNARDITVDGDYVYVGGWNTGVQIISIADPTNPTIVGSYDTPGYAAEVAVDGDLAVVADYDSGLVLLDVSDPTNPSLLADLTSLGLTAGVSIAGNLAVAACWASGLVTIDISDPTTPVVLGSYDTPGQAQYVDIAGDIALVADGSGGLQLVDISDPTNPSLAGSYNAGSSLALAAKAAGDFAYVAYHDQGLHVIDITDPTSPTYLTENSFQEVRRVVVSGRRVYGAYLTRGFRAYQLFQDDAADKTAVLSGRSLNVDGDGSTVLKLRMFSTQTPGVQWYVTANGGTNWTTIMPVGTWVDFGSWAGHDLRWRTNHTWSAADGNPTVSDVTLEWLSYHAPITSIMDVPGDQGGLVRLSLTRSAYDFWDEPSHPITGYQIYQRVDDMVASPARSGEEAAARDIKVAPLEGIHQWSEGGRVLARNPASGFGTFPPGTWEAVAWVAATQSDTYNVRVSTLADSTSAGPGWSVYLVTTHTTTPGVWYVSNPDSGYSVDNLAPAPPAAFQVSYNVPGGNQLDWGASPENDLSHYAIYRGTATGAANAAFGVASEGFTLVHTTMDKNWFDAIDEGWQYVYRISAVDRNGNESVWAAPGTTTGVGRPTIPDRFDLHPNVPNPFNPTTRITFDVPKGGAYVTLRVYDVKGRLVRTLVSGPQPEGQNTVTWNGRNHSGNLVSTGIYFCRLTAPGFERTRKMTLIK